MAKETKTAPAKPTTTETKTKTEPKKERVVKPAPVIPSLDSFKDKEAQTQFENILKASKNLVDVFKSALKINSNDLREVRRGIHIATTEVIKGRKPDQTEKKRDKLLAQIEKSKAALKEMGIEI